MLNKIWLIIMASSLLYSFFANTYSDVIQSAFETGSECISLMFTLLASMSFFTGIMKIAEKSGITKRIAKLTTPLLKKLFPEIPKDHSAFADMSMNISANLLGMGNAATPLGIKAMKSLKELSVEKEDATRAMCLFTVMNTSSIQLIPSTIIAMRMNYNSASPFIVTIPILISGFTGLISGIIAVKMIWRKNYGIY